MISAAVLLAFDLQAAVFWAIHGVVALVAGFAGWIVTPIVARALCRIAFHRPIPGWATFLSRLAGAALLVNLPGVDAVSRYTKTEELVFKVRKNLFETLAFTARKPRA